jgi:PKHD-type hydroxylase
VKTAVDVADARRVADFVLQVPAVFTADECASLVGRIGDLGQTVGTISRGEQGDSALDREIRRVRQTTLPRTDAGWALERVDQLVAGCNEKHFGFEVDGFGDSVLIVDYRQGDFYDWHLDVGAGESGRKLSVSVVLSPPDDYEGGGLTFPGARFDSVPQGDAMVFASFLLHGVQPVKRGRRCALVGWAEGPPFR